MPRLGMLNSAAARLSAVVLSACNTLLGFVSVFDRHLLNLFERGLDFLKLQANLAWKIIDEYRRQIHEKLHLAININGRSAWSHGAWVLQFSRDLVVLLRCTCRGDSRNWSSYLPRPLLQLQNPHLRSSTGWLQSTQSMAGKEEDISCQTGQPAVSRSSAESNALK